MEKLEFWTETHSSPKHKIAPHFGTLRENQPQESTPRSVKYSHKGWLHHTQLEVPADSSD